MTVIHQGPVIHQCAVPNSSYPSRRNPEFWRYAKESAGQGTLWRCDVCEAVWKTKQEWLLGSAWWWYKLTRRAGQRAIRKVSL